MSTQGYDVVVINYRGLAGAPLTTPRLYTAYSWEDVLEPMKFVYEKYCVPEGKQAFAMGCSMGSGILGNLIGHLGENCFLEAATLVNPPMKLLVCENSIRTSAFGAYNTALGKNLE
jgi:predicted alpha/beta-fold hydrolase